MEVVVLLGERVDRVKRVVGRNGRVRGLEWEEGEGMGRVKDWVLKGERDRLRPGDRSVLAGLW